MKDPFVECIISYCVCVQGMHGAKREGRRCQRLPPLLAALLSNTSFSLKVNYVLCTVPKAWLH